MRELLSYFLFFKSSQYEDKLSSIVCERANIQIPIGFPGILAYVMKITSSPTIHAVLAVDEKITVFFLQAWNRTLSGRLCKIYCLTNVECLSSRLKGKNA